MLQSLWNVRFLVCNGLKKGFLIRSGVWCSSPFCSSVYWMLHYIEPWGINFYIFVLGNEVDKFILHCARNQVHIFFKD
jgi:hypothetical protein